MIKTLMRSFLVVCFALIPITTAEAITIDDLMDQVRHRYADIQTMKARFEQQNYLSATDNSMWFHGNLYFMKPLSLKIHVSKPDEQIIVADSSLLWVHIPILKQLTIQPLPKDINSQTILSMLMGSGDPRENFNVEWASDSKPDSEGNYRIVLTPLSSKETTGRIEVAVDSKTYYMVGFILKDRLGNSQDFELKDIEINQELSPELFRMTVPEGTTVIKPQALPGVNP